VSKYTSLVAVDDEPCPCGDFQRQVQVPNEVPDATTLMSALHTGGSGYGSSGSAYGVGYGMLGAKGSGRAGGGSAAGIGGLGSRGIGSGASGYGAGGGHFGAKGEGALHAVGGDPIILGALDRSLIDEVVRRHMNQIRYCYQRRLIVDHTLAGKVVVKFVIASDGTVSSATIKSSTLDDDAVEQCLLGRFRRMRFPAAPGIVVVTYPFLFSAG